MMLTPLITRSRVWPVRIAWEEARVASAALDCERLTTTSTPVSNSMEISRFWASSSCWVCANRSCRSSKSKPLCSPAPNSDSRAKMRAASPGNSVSSKAASLRSTLPMAASNRSRKGSMAAGSETVNALASSSVAALPAACNSAKLR